MSLKSFCYRVHGLNINSQIRLPGILSKKSKSDVNIYIDSIGSIPDGNLCEYNLKDNFRLIDDQNITYILWKNKEICSISSDEIIINNKLKNVNGSFSEAIVLPIAIPVLLRKRGMLVLHANAVNMNGNSVIFIGSKGVGKSTISIALHKKGYNLLSDDISTVHFSGDSLLVSSGFPTLKLWPQTIEYFGENPDELPKCSPNQEKRAYFNINNFYETTLPLKSIYLIEENSDDSFIKQISNQKAVINLVNTTLFAKIFDGSQLSENLEQCAKIVNSVPIKILKVKHSLNSLPELVKVIEDDFFNI